MKHTVAYLLKTRTVEPEKQLLLHNALTQQERNCHNMRCDIYSHWSDWVSTFPQRQIHATIEKLFSVQSILRVYKKDKEDCLCQSSSRVCSWQNN
jgi:hypothetical protein